MASPKDGGPAFAQHGWTSDPEVLERMKKLGGMSMRQYYKGQALSNANILMVEALSEIGEVAANAKAHAVATVRLAAELADAAIAEDEAHAKK